MKHGLADTENTKDHGQPNNGILDDLPPIEPLPPLRVRKNRPSSASSKGSSSRGSRKSQDIHQDVLHMDALCSRELLIKSTKSNLDIIPEEQMSSSTVDEESNVALGIDKLDNAFGENGPHKLGLAVQKEDQKMRLKSKSAGPETGTVTGVNRRLSFAGYHKCRTRSASVPVNNANLGLTPKVSSLVRTDSSQMRTSERNLHRTHSGLGFMGEIVAEEEANKSKILSIFEADISSKKIKTFYNGVVGILEDRQRQDKIINEDNILIIHPLSTFRLVWDTVLLAAIFLTMIVLPVKIAFYRIFDNDNDENKWLWYPIIAIIDTLFMTDVVLAFFTGTVESNQNPPRINLNRKAIRCHYLKTWFIPDLLSSIPFDIIGSEMTVSSDAQAVTIGASKILLTAKVLKVFALIRVLRVGRLHCISKRWIQIFEISPLVIKIVQLLCYFFMIAHWSACIQFFVVYIRDYPEKSWPVLIGIQEAPIFHQYVWSLFRSLSHMITIGYGKAPPEEVIEVCLIIPSMMIGAFFYMMIISQMTKTISMFRIGDIRYTQKLKEVDEFARKYHLTGDIHQRMHEFYHHKFGGVIHDEDEIIKEMPLALKIDVIKFKNAEMLENVFFLRSACDGFIEQFILSTKSVVFMSGDIIIRSEDTIENLYIIQKGTVSIEFTTEGNTLQDDIIIRRYGFFGETPMLLQKNANMMVYAETPCDFVLCPQYIFHSLLEAYPLFKHQMLLVAQSRVLLQGLDPASHAPGFAEAFTTAQLDKSAVRSTEDILELASMARLDSQGMEEFRHRNTLDYSVFRTVTPRKKGEKAPSTRTPIDVLNTDYHDPKDFHLSVSIHDDRINTKVSDQHYDIGVEPRPSIAH